jgi:cell division septum initiation protein DivIVA
MGIDYEWEQEVDAAEKQVAEKQAADPHEMLVLQNAFQPGLSIKAAMMRFDGYVAKCQSLSNTIQGLDVKDDVSAKLASELGAGASKLVKAINLEKDQIIGPANEFVNSVRNLATSLTEPLQEAKRTSAQKLSQYNEILRIEKAKRDREEAAKAVADQAFLDAMASKAGVAPVVLEPPAPKAAKTKIRTASGTSYEHKEWKWAEVEGEFDKIPAEYKLTILDTKKLDEAVKAGKRNPQIPGINIFEKIDTRFRG